MLPSEWHKQRFVQLTWPHENTDWQPVLEEAYTCYIAMAKAIADVEPLVVMAQYPETVERQLIENNVNMGNVTIVECINNDTWARDHGFITTIDHCTENRTNKAEQLLTFHDFQFNGWGLKFAACHDNQLNATLYNSLLDKTGKYLPHLNFVLEGGSIESDGRGTLLTTSTCLLAPNRNQPMTRKEIEDYLIKVFEAKRVLWLEHSWLEGDDTDGHIDTVARLCPEDTIVYTKCYDKNDVHSNELDGMEKELTAFRTLDGKPYKLIPLPLPDACYDEEGNRLPATYANFLILNGTVLYPTYNQPVKDAEAALLLQKAFPKYKIIGIDCRVLIIQHGSLHCCTMQYPA